MVSSLKVDNGLEMNSEVFVVSTRNIITLPLSKQYGNFETTSQETLQMVAL